MEYKFKKSMPVRSGNGPFNLGVSTYTNDIDYCLIEDFIEDYKEKQKKEIRKTVAEAGVKEPPLFILAVGRDDLCQLLDDIYTIQRIPMKEKGLFLKTVSERMPYIVERKRNVLSAEFLREMWYSGEFLEQLLSSDAEQFLINDWVK